jgi:hypothetical protein
MFRKLQKSSTPDWFVRIMAQELAHPTPALPTVVEHVMQPNYVKVLSLVGSILDRPAADDVTRMCVHSIMGQVMHYAHAQAVLALLWPQFQLTPKRVEQVADHIITFTLGGIAAIRAERKSHNASKSRSSERVPPRARV